MQKEDPIEKLKDKKYRVGELAYGSLQERMNTCTRPNCKCKRGSKHGPYYYLSFRGRDGKLRHIYLRKEEVENIRRRLDKFEELMKNILRIQESMKKR